MYLVRGFAAIAVVWGAALATPASAQAPTGTYTCTFFGSRYVGTGWNLNGRKFTFSDSNSAVASRTAQKLCQDDYLREGLDPNSIVNACMYGPCDFKPTTPSNYQQIDPKVQQTCNAYADSVVRHYEFFKSNCPSGNYGFPIDRAKYYGDCTAGMLFYKKKFDPQANDYRKQVAANCARKGPFFQPNTGGPAPSSAGARSFAVAAKPGLCIDVEKGRAAAGTKIQLWNCTGRGAQKFVLESGSGRIRFAGSNFCVEQVPGGRPLVLTPCNQTFNRWTFDGGSGRIVGAGPAAGKCWDVPGGRFNPLQYVGIWQCHNGREQQFQLP